MALSTSANKVIHSGNGVATSFPYTFPILEASHLQVIYTDTGGNAITLASGLYSATGIGGAAGGAVTYPLSGSPLANGETLTILRAVPLTQTTVFSNQGGYYPEIVEQRFDRVTMGLQQLSEEIGRATLDPPSVQRADVVATLADLKALTSRPAAVLVKTGQAAGVWQWVSGSATTADDALVVQCTSGAAGRYKRIVPNGRYDVAWWGADLTGATDSAAAVNAALAAMSAAGGGTVYVPAGGKLLISSAHLTVPARVTFDLGLDAAEITANTDTSYAAWPHLQLSSSYEIKLYGQIQNGLIFRAGMTFPAANSSAFAGLAIRAMAGGAATRDIMVLGFEQAFKADGRDRIRLDGKFYADCLGKAAEGAVDLRDSYDSSFVEDLHLWPFCTVGYNGGSPANSALQRPGMGLRITGRADDTTCHKLFAFGYKQNFLLDADGNVTADLVWSDYTAGAASDTIGFATGGMLGKTVIDKLYAYSSHKTVKFNHTTGTVAIGALIQAFSPANGVDVETGHVFVQHAQITDNTSWAIAGAAGSEAYHVEFEGGFAQRNGTPVFAVPPASTDENWRIGIKTDGTAGSSKFGANYPLFATVASVGSLQPPVNSDFVKVTGTTSITSIQGAWGRRVLTLIFDGVLTVTHGGNISLQGGVNFTTAAGSMIELVYDAVNALWRERWRSPIASVPWVFSSLQSINLSGQTLPSALSNSVLQLMGPGSTRVTVESIGNTGVASFRRTNGSFSSPSALQLNDGILTLNVLGYGATGYSSSSRGSVVINAAENWTDIAQGTYGQLTAVPIGTTTNTAIAQWDGIGFKVLNGKQLWLGNSYSAGSVPVTTGTLTIYDSTGTAYRIPVAV